MVGWRALLELGAGFNPELDRPRKHRTCARGCYGLDSATIDAERDAMIAFADIGDYIDRPVKRYSSGMFTRLAFAVAAHVDADILIVDEALAVGDAFFVQKCMRHLERVREAGGAAHLRQPRHGCGHRVVRSRSLALRGPDRDGCGAEGSGRRLPRGAVRRRRAGRNDSCRKAGDRCRRRSSRCADPRRAVAQRHCHRRLRAGARLRRRRRAHRFGGVRRDGWRAAVPHRGRRMRRARRAGPCATGASTR